MIERKCVRFFFGEQLHRQLPFGKVAALDGLEQVAAMEVIVSRLQFQRFVPDR